MFHSRGSGSPLVEKERVVDRFFGGRAGDGGPAPGPSAKKEQS